MQSTQFQTMQDLSISIHIYWAYLDNVKDTVVIELVLTLPHSNADEERVLSFIRQKKTDFRCSLSQTRWHTGQHSHS